MEEYDIMIEIIEFLMSRPLLVMYKAGNNCWQNGAVLLS